MMLKTGFYCLQNDQHYFNITDTVIVNDVTCMCQMLLHVWSKNFFILDTTSDTMLITAMSYDKGYHHMVAVFTNTYDQVGI